MKIILLLLITVSSFAQSNRDFNLEVLREINVRRTSAGLPEVKYAPSLQLTLNNKAKRMTKSFSHDYSAGREVILKCNISNEEVMVNLFFSSPKHKAILMDKNAKYICVGTYRSPNVKLPFRFFGVIRTYSGKGNIVKAVFLSASSD